MNEKQEGLMVSDDFILKCVRKRIEMENWSAKDIYDRFLQNHTDYSFDMVESIFKWGEFTIDLRVNGDGTRENQFSYVLGFYYSDDFIEVEKPVVNFF